MSNEEIIIPQKTREIEMNDGDVQLTSLEDLHRYSNMLLRSGMLPKQYDKPEKISAAIQFAKELNLPPLNALRNIAVINGSPSLWGDLPLAIVRSSGHLEEINEFTIDKDYKVICFENKNLGADIFAAICEIKRKGYEKRSYAYTALDASLNPSSNSQVWKSYRPVMMKRKARSVALKDEFPDLLAGAPIAEYDHDVIPSAGSFIEVASAKEEKTKSLNEKFS